MEKSRAGGVFTCWREWLAGSEQPRLACEVAADGVAAARRARTSLKIEAWATKPLPEGVVRPGPLAEDVLDSGALAEALQEVLREVGGGEKRVGVILPDSVARVWLLRVESLPARPAEATALLRWRLAKEVAFDFEQAFVAYQVFSRGESDRAVLVAAAQRACLRQYEERFETLGFEPTWVTLATLSTLGWLETEPTVSQLLVRHDPSSLGLAIVQGSELRLLRSVPTTMADGSAETLFEQIYPSLVYFQDEWGEPVREAVLVGVGEARGELARLLEREAGCRARELRLDSWAGELRPAVRSGDGAQRLAAALGFLRAGVQP